VAEKGNDVDGGGGMTSKTMITVKTLVRRVNRALARRDGCVHGEAWPYRCDGVHQCLPTKKLKVTRGMRTRHAVGDFYLVDIATNDVETHVSLPHLARELKVLQRWEELEELDT
jgi:hypothetical protein